MAQTSRAAEHQSVIGREYSCDSCAPTIGQCLPYYGNIGKISIAQATAWDAGIHQRQRRISRTSLLIAAFFSLEQEIDCIMNGARWSVKSFKYRYLNIRTSGPSRSLSFVLFFQLFYAGASFTDGTWFTPRHCSITLLSKRAAQIHPRHYPYRDHGVTILADDNYSSYFSR